MRSAILVAVAATAIVARAQDWSEAEEEARAGYATAIGNVRVVDTDGHGVAGVPVAAFFPLGDREIAAVLGTDHAISRVGVPPLDVVAETDADGRCHLPIQYGGMPLAMISAIVGFRRQSVEFRIRAPFAAPPSRRILIHELGTGDVLLTLPRSTRLKVKLIRADGTSDNRPARVGIERLDLRRSPRTGESHDLPSTGAVVHPTTDGIAEFPFVGLGQTILVSARIHGDDAVRFRELVIAADSDMSEIVVPLGPGDVSRDVTWTARLIGNGDRPLAHRDVELQIQKRALLVDREKLFDESDSGSLCKVRARTDGDGRLEVALSGVADPGPWIETSVDIEVMNPTSGAPDLAAALTVSRGLRRGRDDFGDLRVSRGAFFYSGVVVDDRDRPIAGARVSLARLEFGVFGMNVPRPTAFGRELAYAAWNPVGGAVATTNADGFFALFGPPRSGRFLLNCEKRGYLQPEPVLFDRAPRMGNVRMRSAAVVEGQVILEKDVPKEFVTINVDGKFDQPIPRYSMSPRWSADFVFERFTRGIDFPIDTDGRILIPALPQGLATVSVRVSAMTALKSQNVQLDPGVVARPADLSSVDLRGRTKSYRFVVKDENGNPIDGARVGFFARDMVRGPVCSFTDEEGRCALVTLGEEPIDVFVVGPKSSGPWIKPRITPVAHETEVILKRLKVVTVKVGNPLALPRAPYFVSVVFDREEAKGSNERTRLFGAFGASNRGAVIDGSGAGTVAVPEAGRYSVKVVIGVIMPDLGWDVPVDYIGPTTVDLAADGKDTVEIEVTGDAWLKAVKSATGALFK